MARADFLMALRARVETLGGAVLSSVTHFGAVMRFQWQLLCSVFSRPFQLRAVLQQVHYLGNYSLPIIVVAGAFVGMALGLQGHNVLRRYGSENIIGLSVALSLLRELGAVMTALFFAGRAGSSLTSEVGLMKASDQLQAMEVMSVSPIKFVLVPRFLAGVIAVPLLTLIFNGCGVLGGYLVTVPWLGIDSGIYWSQIQTAIEPIEVRNALIKGIVFGVVVNLTALYQGYIAKPTPIGVSKATTRSVVIASILVLVLDFVMSYTMLGLQFGL